MEQDSVEEFLSSSKSVLQNIHTSLSSISSEEQSLLLLRGQIKNYNKIIEENNRKNVLIQNLYDKIMLLENEKNIYKQQEVEIIPIMNERIFILEESLKEKEHCEILLTEKLHTTNEEKNNLEILFEQEIEKTSLQHDRIIKLEDENNRLRFEVEENNKRFLEFELFFNNFNLETKENESFYENVQKNWLKSEKRINKENIQLKETLFSLQEQLDKSSCEIQQLEEKNSYYSSKLSLLETSFEKSSQHAEYLSKKLSTVERKYNNNKLLLKNQLVINHFNQKLLLKKNFLIQNLLLKISQSNDENIQNIFIYYYNKLVTYFSTLVSSSMSSVSHSLEIKLLQEFNQSLFKLLTSKSGEIDVNFNDLYLFFNNLFTKDESEMSLKFDHYNKEILELNKKLDDDRKENNEDYNKSLDEKLSHLIKEEELIHDSDDQLVQKFNHFLHFTSSKSKNNSKNESLLLYLFNFVDNFFSSLVTNNNNSFEISNIFVHLTNELKEVNRKDLDLPSSFSPVVCSSSVLETDDDSSSEEELNHINKKKSQKLKFSNDSKIFYLNYNMNESEDQKLKINKEIELKSKNINLDLLKKTNKLVSNYFLSQCSNNHIIKNFYTLFHLLNNKVELNKNLEQFLKKHPNVKKLYKNEKNLDKSLSTLENSSSSIFLLMSLSHLLESYKDNSLNVSQIQELKKEIIQIKNFIQDKSHERNEEKYYNEVLFNELNDIISSENNDHIKERQYNELLKIELKKEKYDFQLKYEKYLQEKMNFDVEFNKYNTEKYNFSEEKKKLNQEISELKAKNELLSKNSDKEYILSEIESLKSREKEIERELYQSKKDRAFEREKNKEVVKELETQSEVERERQLEMAHYNFIIEKENEIKKIIYDNEINMKNILISEKEKYNSIIKKNEKQIKTLIDNESKLKSFIHELITSNNKKNKNILNYLLQIFFIFINFVNDYNISNDSLFLTKNSNNSNLIYFLKSFYNGYNIMQKDFNIIINNFNNTINRNNHSSSLTHKNNNKDDYTNLLLKKSKKTLKIYVYFVLAHNRFTSILKERKNKKSNKNFIKDYFVSKFITNNIELSKYKDYYNSTSNTFSSTLPNSISSSNYLFTSSPSSPKRSISSDSSTSPKSTSLKSDSPIKNNNFNITDINTFLKSINNDKDDNIEKIIDSILTFFNQLNLPSIQEIISRDSDTITSIVYEKIKEKIDITKEKKKKLNNKNLLEFLTSNNSNYYNKKILFSPPTKFKNYRFEFFSQRELNYLNTFILTMFSENLLDKEKWIKFSSNTDLKYYKNKIKQLEKKIENLNDDLEQESKIKNNISQVLHLVVKDYSRNQENSPINIANVLKHLGINVNDFSFYNSQNNSLNNSFNSSINSSFNKLNQTSTSIDTSLPQRSIFSNILEKNIRERVLPNNYSIIEKFYGEHEGKEDGSNTSYSAKESNQSFQNSVLDNSTYSVDNNPSNLSYLTKIKQYEDKTEEKINSLDNSTYSRDSKNESDFLDLFNDIQKLSAKVSKNSNIN